MIMTFCDLPARVIGAICRIKGPMDICTEGQTDIKVEIIIYISYLPYKKGKMSLGCKCTMKLQKCVDINHVKRPKQESRWWPENRDATKIAPKILVGSKIYGILEVNHHHLGKTHAEWLPPNMKWKEKNSHVLTFLWYWRLCIFFLHTTEIRLRLQSNSPYCEQFLTARNKMEIGLLKFHQIGKLYHSKIIGSI